jgi:hypothetical protein
VAVGAKADRCFALFVLFGQLFAEQATIAAFLEFDGYDAIFV